MNYKTFAPPEELKSRIKYFLALVDNDTDTFVLVCIVLFKYRSRDKGLQYFESKG